jgi:hypothetical protein
VKAAKVPEKRRRGGHLKGQRGDDMSVRAEGRTQGRAKRRAESSIPSENTSRAGQGRVAKSSK